MAYSAPTEGKRIIGERGKNLLLERCGRNGSGRRVKKYYHMVNGFP